MLQLNFTPFPELSTENLVLRSLQTSDAPELFILRTDDQVNAFLDRPRPNTIEDVRSFIGKIIANVAKNESVYWVIAPKNDPKIAGTIVFWNISPENDRAEIGYELHPDFQGKGIMQEAFSAVVAYGFEKMKLQTILAYPQADNERSIRILEKNGFQRMPDLENVEGLLNTAGYALSGKLEV